MSKTTNNFKSDLAYSFNDDQFWEIAYREYFPTLIDTELCHDLTRQKQGIDRIITLENGKQFSIDEKKRRKMWGDILLEFISSDNTFSPGWIEKDLSIDFLAYAFMDERKVYFFSFPLLRRVWKYYGRLWIERGYKNQQGFRLIVAKNDSYSTWSVAVPIKTLQDTLSRGSVVTLNR